MKSLLSALIVTTYILSCLLKRTGPWNYFQINARYFSRDKGIFSKIAIDNMIPDRWRLRQQRLDMQFVPEEYPVFLKPEWGQNAIGIERADTSTQFDELRLKLLTSEADYIVQEAAHESREFEIFTTFPHASDVSADIITVTESVNNTHRYPINGIYNNDCHYQDLTDQLDEAALLQLAGHIRELGHFGQSRLAARADSIADLVNGEFHIIELNLFTPMPLNLLDENHSLLRKLQFIGSVSWSLAEVTKYLSHGPDTPAIYRRMLNYSRSRLKSGTAAATSLTASRSGTAAKIDTAQKKYLKTLGVLRSFL